MPFLGNEFSKIFEDLFTMTLFTKITHSWWHFETSWLCKVFLKITQTKWYSWVPSDTLGVKNAVSKIIGEFIKILNFQFFEKTETQEKDCESNCSDILQSDLAIELKIGSCDSNIWTTEKLCSISTGIRVFNHETKKYSTTQNIHLELKSGFRCENSDQIRGNPCCKYTPEYCCTKKDLPLSHRLQSLEQDLSTVKIDINRIKYQANDKPGLKNYYNKFSNLIWVENFLTKP